MPLPSFKCYVGQAEKRDRGPEPQGLCALGRDIDQTSTHPTPDPLNQRQGLDAIPRKFHTVIFSRFEKPLEGGQVCVGDVVHVLASVHGKEAESGRARR